MKSCNYFYKGRLIGDIIALDDFLLTNQKYYANVSDRVFQEAKTLDSAKVNKVTETLRKAKKDNLDKIKAWSEAKKLMINDEELVKLKRPLVGLTEFLSGQTDANGRLYFPEFDEGEYWSRRFYAWTSGKKAEEPNGSDGFTEAEIELFFNGDESLITAIPLGNDKEWKNANGSFKVDPSDKSRVKFGTDEQNRLRELMEEKWKHQALYGTEIHNILQACFTYTNENKPDKPHDLWLDLLTGPNANFHLVNFEKNLRKNTNSGITDLTSHERVLETIEYAKKLRESMQDKFGTDLKFFSEYTLSAKLNKEFEGKTGMDVVGRVDLIVLDSRGIPHIIDYKTSPKPYDSYSSAKKLAFTYLLATYERMLRRLGIYTGGTELMIAPIKMSNFRKEGGSWVYDKVEAASVELLKSITDNANKEHIINNLNDYIEEPQVLEGTADNIIEKVKKTFEQWFPDYGNTQVKNDEEIRNIIKRQKADVPNNKGEFVFKTRNGGRQIIAKSEAELFKAVKNYYSAAKEKASKDAERVIDAVNSAKKNEYQQLELSYSDEWLRNKLSKYLGSTWEILDDDAARAARQFGVILFYNNKLDYVEVVRMSSSTDLREIHKFGKNRTNLTGSFEPDTIENVKSNSLALKAARGNIELMETMLILNALDYGKEMKIGRIDVLHKAQDKSTGLSASNKELKYNWDKLNKFKKVEGNDLFASGNWKLITKAEACYFEFKDIIERDLKNEVTTKMKDSIIPMEDYYSNITSDPEIALIRLNELRQKLENELNMNAVMEDEHINRHSGVGNYYYDLTRILYQQVMSAILELRNFHVRLALSDHKPFFESFNIIKNGISGNMMDNAGNFGNQMLNQITSLALEGYQNARDAAYGKLNALRLKTELLKKDMNYSGFVEHTYGNQTSLYKGMIEYVDGDLRFINPWKENNLLPAQVEYLKYAILEINKLIHRGQTEEAIKAKIESNDPEFFQVPLVEASFASKVGTEGWSQWLKNKFGQFSSKEKILESLKDFLSEFFDDEQEKESVDNVIFKVVNLMTLGMKDRRKTIEGKIQKFGEGFFERDVETILSQMVWAYSTSEALLERMPLMKAAYISLNVMGNEQNQSFKNDEEFYRKFVANRINHLSIDPGRMKEVKGAVGIMLAVTSWMALAFSPAQFSYQTIEGIWKDAKLIITKPDGSETFTAKNMWDAAQTVYKELFHFSDTPTVSTAINALYGINDMDNASFAENNTSNKHGVFNFFTKFAYRFSSRPDFYNRMTIFVSLMKADGSWEAHHIDENGELIYNYEEDARFKAFATDDKSDLEAYLLSKSLYYAVAQLLVNEGARNKDGSLFKIGQRLPKAYSNRESEAKKAIADNMYGYYDSTKKSLMLSILLGGLMMLMRTYWSAKKNQYFAPGGIKAQGKWVLMEAEAIDPVTREVIIDPETKKPKMLKYYYAKNDKGEIDYNSDPVPEDHPNRSDTPFRQWKGKFEEGVILTLAGIMHDISTVGWKEMLELRFGENADPELRLVYIANLKLFITDLVMWGVIGMGATTMLGDWADDEEKKAKKSGHMDDAIAATWAKFVHRTIRSSGLDFAWWAAIFDISMDWNPMSISYLANEIAILSNFIFGDEEFSDVVVKSFSAARLVRPIIDCIKND